MSSPGGSVPRADDGIEWEQLRAGMVFIDASYPDRSRRVVILKVYSSKMEIWLVTMGSSRPYKVNSNTFYWGGLTPHKKPRRSGYYLDPAIPGNDWKGKNAQLPYGGH